MHTTSGVRFFCVPTTFLVLLLNLSCSSDEQPQGSAASGAGGNSAMGGLGGYAGVAGYAGTAGSYAGTAGSAGTLVNNGGVSGAGSGAVAGAGATAGSGAGGTGGEPDLPCVDPETTLATGQDNPQYLTARNAEVYWTNWGSDSSTTTGTVMSVGKSGNPVKTLATGLWRPADLVTVGGDVFFKDAGPTIYFGALMKVSTAGGTPITLVDKSINAIVADDNWLYYASKTEIRRIAFDGTNDTLLATYPTGVVSLAIDTSTIYFATIPTFTGDIENNDSLVATVPKTGGNAVILSSDNMYVNSLAVSNGFVYWSDQGSGYDGRICRASIDGGSVIVLAGEQNNPHSVVVDTHHVYWSNLGTLPFQYTDGAVLKTPLAEPGPVTVIANDLNGPSAVAIDNQHIFWVERGTPGVKNGKVISACK